MEEFKEGSIRIDLKQYIRLKKVACEVWGIKIRDLYSEDLLLKGYAYVTKAVYLKAKREATSEQLKLINEILGIKTEETYRIGDVFTIGRRQEEYILSRIGNCEVILINLRTGNCWDNSISVEDSLKITKEELIRLASDAWSITLKRKYNG